jgi:hypothetical protein
VACGNSEEGAEGGMAGFAAVEAEGEFIEIGLQMRRHPVNGTPLTVLRLYGALPA